MVKESQMLISIELQKLIMNSFNPIWEGTHLHTTLIECIIDKLDLHSFFGWFQINLFTIELTNVVMQL